MADKTHKTANNAEGKYYVDDSCSACSLCADLAPDNFKMNEEGSAAHIVKQPADGKETAAVKEAMESCPSGSIGDDG